MTQIALLDHETIDRIAAGEVVERPSSVVKELTENAVDAGADAITVEIRGGGKQLIRVTDNGSGIDGQMVRLAFARHATSKLHSIEDLTRIRTLGFRGEALSSIAAVSKVELMTKTKDALSGTLYRIEGGIEKECRKAGLPQGTTVLVRDLFYHVPARQKFLKTDQTETSCIADLMEELSLSHPEISFHLICDGKTRLQTAGTGSLADVIYSIYGRDVSRNLIAVDQTGENIRMHGCLGKPSLSRGNRRFESVFVNGRLVRDRILQKGLEDGYKRYLMQHQFPFAVLFFEVPGHLVDVNVHPAKAQVRFSEEKAVYDFVCEQVSAALRANELIEELSLRARPGSEEVFSPRAGAEKSQEVLREAHEPYETKARTVPQNDQISSRETSSSPTDQPQAPGRTLRSLFDAQDPCVNRSDPDEGSSRAFQTPGADQTASPSPRAQAAEEDASDAPRESIAGEQLSLPIPPTRRVRFEIIGSLFDTYWLLEYDAKLYLVDQHAAHERVNYEKFLQLFRGTKPSSQQVFPAIPVTLKAQEIALVERYEPYLASCGFEIDHFGGNEYRITAVPTETFGMNTQVFFLSFLDEMSDLSSGTSEPDTITDRLATAACKASIKGHDVISRQEAQHLLEKLFACRDPYHCPHGRPTMVSITKKEIEKMFRRVTT